MELDSQLLQDLMEFLQTLENSTLPAKVEALRVRLMGRMRTALLSSGHYMDMQSGKPLKDNTGSDHSSEEYVIPDQRPLPTKSSLYPQQPKKSDKIEEKPNLLPRKSPNPSPTPTLAQLVLQPPIVAAEEDEEILEELEPLDPVVEVYNTMNLTKAQSKSHHFGQLHRRGKWFLFESIRPFWAALVGWHLLSFDNKTDVKPSQILSIKGCLCRPVVSSPRNTKKLSDSTFELCYGKNKTFQFIASTPKEMHQWVAAIVRWEIKSRDINHVLAVQNATLPPPPPVSEDELSSEEQDQNEEYIEVDLVIDNLAEALANPPKVFRPNQPKPSTVNLPKPAASPIYPKRIVNRVLPPPPSAKRDSEQDEDVYQVIEENNHNQPSTSLPQTFGQRESSTSTDVDCNGVLYDDLDNVMREVKEIEEKSIRKEVERKIPVQESAEDDVGTYDDVNVVRMEVEEIRRIENSAKESALEIDKEKKTPKEVPTKSSPMKNFFGIFKQKNESPQKEGAKKNPVISAPQRPVKTPVSTERPIAQNSSVVLETRSNNQILPDLSDYNSPPHPRPVDGETPVSNGGDDEEEAIYDDICNRNYEFNNHTVSNRKDENIITKNNPIRNEEYPPMTNVHKNVVRNLNEKFKHEIYQNETGNSNVDDDSEHYKVPRLDANAHMHIPVEDDDTEKIYDDVAIVAQKKREIVQAKEKPSVVSKPKYNRGPAVLAKPFEKNFLNKLNKFTSSAAEKSAIEKNKQHRYSPGKKSKPQDAIITLKKHQLMSADEQIYDDCQATKG